MNEEERIRNLENKYISMEGKLDSICDSLASLKKEIEDRIPTKHEVEIENSKQNRILRKEMEEKYATINRMQRLEKIVYFIIGLLVSGSIAMLAFLFERFSELI